MLHYEFLVCFEMKIFWQQFWKFYLSIYKLYWIFIITVTTTIIEIPSDKISAIQLILLASVRQASLLWTVFIKQSTDCQRPDLIDQPIWSSDKNWMKTCLISSWFWLCLQSKNRINFNSYIASNKTWVSESFATRSSGNE